LKSSLLHYKLLLHRTGRQDNPRCKLSKRERLKALERQDESWFNFHPDFRRTIPVPFSTGNLYDIADGVLLFNSTNKQTLNFMRLPQNAADKQPEWQTFSVIPQGLGAEYPQNMDIVDFGLSIRENDLIALVTAFVLLQLDLFKKSNSYHTEPVF
jgi:hypothetical protein